VPDGHRRRPAWPKPCRRSSAWARGFDPYFAQTLCSPPYIHPIAATVPLDARPCIRTGTSVPYLGAMMEQKLASRARIAGYIVGTVVVERTRSSAP